MDEKVKIVHPGTVVLTSSGIVVAGWTFDLGALEGRTEENRRACAIAVRDYIVERINKEYGLQGNHAEPPPSPVSAQNERAAEMETYLLINRCQGNA